MRARTLLLILVPVLIAGGGYGVFWYQAAETLERSIDRWIAAERRYGAEISHDPIAVSGFPLSLAIDLTSINARWPDDIAWVGERVQLSAKPWDWQMIDFDFAGHHRLTIEGGRRGEMVRVSARDTQGQLRLDDRGQPRAIDAVASAISVAPARRDGTEGTASTIDRASVSVARPAPVADDPLAPSLETRLDLQGLIILPDVQLGLDNRVKSVEFQGHVTGPLPPMLTNATVAAWSQAGGTVEVTRMQVDWGEMSIGADGTLALDENLQPIGAFSTRVTGYDRVIDAMVQTRTITSGTGRIAKGALGMLATRDGADAPPQVDAPLTIEDGYVRIGPVPLLPVPEITWDETVES